MPTTDVMPNTDNDKLNLIEQDIERQQEEESIVDSVFYRIIIMLSFEAFALLIIKCKKTKTLHR